MEKAKEVVQKLAPKPKPEKVETDHLKKVIGEFIEYTTNELRHTLTSIDSHEDPNRRLSMLAKESAGILEKKKIIDRYREILEVL